MKKELTMEMRLLIAFVLMGLVLFITPYIYKQPPPPPANQAPAKADAAKSDTAKSEPAEKPPPATPAVAPDIPGQIQASAEEEPTVDTDLYHVVFSNRGAVVESWVLKAYKDRAGKPLDLVNPHSVGKIPAPFSL